MALNTDQGRITLPVKGMYCSSCVSKVEHALRAVPGVRKARVDLAAERAILEIEPERVGVEEIKGTVRELGYEVPGQAGPGESTADVRPERLDVLLRSRDRFLRFLESRMASRAEAEDLLQTAFLKAMTGGHADPDAERVVAWFYQLIRHLLVDHYRHRAAQDRAMERVATEMQAGVGRGVELLGAVCTCVNEVLEVLKPADAELIRRVEIEGKPVRDVASALGITANNASVRLHRARHALREALQATCGACAEHGYG